MIQIVMIKGTALQWKRRFGRRVHTEHWPHWTWFCCIDWSEVSASI